MKMEVLIKKCYKTRQNGCLIAKNEHFIQNLINLG